MALRIARMRDLLFRDRRYGRVAASSPRIFVAYWPISFFRIRTKKWKFPETPKSEKNRLFRVSSLPRERGNPKKSFFFTFSHFLKFRKFLEIVKFLNSLKVGNLDLDKEMIKFQGILEKLQFPGILKKHFFGTLPNFRVPCKIWWHLVKVMSRFVKDLRKF